MAEYGLSQTSSMVSLLKMLNSLPSTSAISYVECAFSKLHAAVCVVALQTLRSVRTMHMHSVASTQGVQPYSVSTCCSWCPLMCPGCLSALIAAMLFEVKTSCISHVYHLPCVHDCRLPSCGGWPVKAPTHDSKPWNAAFAENIPDHEERIVMMWHNGCKDTVQWQAEHHLRTCTAHLSPALHQAKVCTNAALVFAWGRVIMFAAITLFAGLTKSAQVGSSDRWWWWWSVQTANSNVCEQWATDTSTQGVLWRLIRSLCWNCSFSCWSHNRIYDIWARLASQWRSITHQNTNGVWMVRRSLEA